MRGMTEGKRDGDIYGRERESEKRQTIIMGDKIRTTKEATDIKERQKKQ